MKYHTAIHALLNTVTVQLPNKIYDAYGESEGYETVDMTLLRIGVSKTIAEVRRDAFISLLHAYPYPEELASGPSYIALGATLGDQGLAFQFMALGKVLGLWKVITPASMGMEGEEAVNAAGLGYVLMTGWRP